MSRFVDCATIFLHSGEGGRGAVSFFRTRSRSHGKPDGGDGGSGGDVILKLSSQYNSLEHVASGQHYHAGNGQNGASRSRHGADGNDCVISLPAGSIVRAHGEEHKLCEITSRTPQYTLLHGGSGGRGNAHFKTAHNRTPRFAQDGGEAEHMQVDIELCLVADVGFVGLPNAGKSSLLRALSRATPRVGEYAFTSKTPTLGVVPPPPEMYDAQPLTAIDIPGLISGAAEGRGLGNRFLRHLSRVRIIAFVLSLEPLDGLSAHEQFALLVDEIRAHDARLLSRVCVVIANKEDVCSASDTHATLNRFGASVLGDVGGGLPHLSKGTGTDATPPIVSCSATHTTGIEEIRAILYSHHADEL